MSLQARIVHVPHGGAPGHPRSSVRSVTTTSAPCESKSSPRPARSMPTTSPNRPARPAATPATASSMTTQCRGSTSSCCAARKKLSGAGLPASPSSATERPSTRTSNSWVRPAISSTVSQLRLADTTAVLRPAARTLRRELARVVKDLDTFATDDFVDPVVLASSDAVDGVAGRRVGGVALRKVEVPGFREPPHAVLARHAIDVAAVVVPRERIEAHGVLPAEYLVERDLPCPVVLLGGARQHSVEVEEHRSKVADISHRPVVDSG